jgi:hypothetical protein
MSEIKRKPLLSTNNHKTIKGEKLGYITFILYMSPYTANSKGVNVCSHASRGCADSCLVGSGNGGMFPKVMQGRIDKTEYFLRDRVGFFNQLKSEIEKAIKKHEGKAIVTFRLNGTSDIAYERFRVFDGKNIFEIFPDIQFYDYTKNHTRFEKALPSNYHLTFSRSETNHAKAIELLNKGKNVAIVFDKLPSTYEGFEVISGDEDDLTFLKPKGVILGLKYKFMTGRGGGEKNKLAFSSGFVINTAKTLENTIKKYDKTVENFKSKTDLVLTD